ncbi:hypothetical protein TUM17387_15920 [Shewanella carassii]|nr:hypothetical protein TUM17387_15920 [Shewanella carassii]
MTTEVSSTPGASSMVTSLFTEPSSMALMVPPRQLRALIFIIFSRRTLESMLIIILTNKKMSLLDEKLLYGP